MFILVTCRSQFYFCLLSYSLGGSTLNTYYISLFIFWSKTVYPIVLLKNIILINVNHLLLFVFVVQISIPYGRMKNGKKIYIPYFVWDFVCPLTVLTYWKYFLLTRDAVYIGIYVSFCERTFTHIPEENFLLVTVVWVSNFTTLQPWYLGSQNSNVHEIPQLYINILDSLQIETAWFPKGILIVTEMCFFLLNFQYFSAIKTKN